jgi:hypothetical protein
MRWIAELVWDRSLTPFENIATWALGIVAFTLLYAFIVLAFILGE